MQNGSSFHLPSYERNGVVEFMSDLIGVENTESLGGVLEMFHDMTGLLLALMEHSSDELDEQGEPGENFELLDRAYARLRRSKEIPVAIKSRVERLLYEGHLKRRQMRLVDYFV